MRRVNNSCTNQANSFFSCQHICSLWENEFNRVYCKSLRINRSLSNPAISPIESGSGHQVFLQKHFPQKTFSYVLRSCGIAGLESGPLCEIWLRSVEKYISFEGKQMLFFVAVLDSPYKQNKHVLSASMEGGSPQKFFIVEFTI